MQGRPLGDEVLLRIRTNEDARCAELKYERADQWPSALVAGGDSYSGRDRLGQLLDHEPELVGLSEQPLEVEKASGLVSLAISHGRCRPTRRHGAGHSWRANDNNARAIHIHHHAGYEEAVLLWPASGARSGMRASPDSARIRSEYRVRAPITPATPGRYEVAGAAASPVLVETAVGGVRF